MALKPTALRSAEARWLAERANPVAQRFSIPAKLKVDSRKPTVAGPAAAYDRIIAHGRRGLSVQHFIG
jgi:DNA gyrase subunit B